MLSDDLKKPTFYIPTIATMFFGLLSVYLYFNPIQQKELSYLLSDDTLKIYNSKVFSPNFTVIDKTRNIINEDIYLKKILIWNSGNLPIEPQDIRRDLELTSINCKKIIDCQIIGVSDSLISDIKLTIDTSNQTNRINIKWAHFDPGFYVKFFIIYTGNTDTKFSLDGNIVGINKIKNGKPIDKRYGWIILIIGIISLGIAYYVNKFLKYLINMIFKNLTLNNIFKTLEKHIKFKPFGIILVFTFGILTMIYYMTLWVFVMITLIRLLNVILKIPSPPIAF